MEHPDGNASRSFFVEVLSDAPEEAHRPRFVEAFVVTVEPRNCGPLVKYLSSKLPLANKDLDLSHLKRVKRTPIVDEPKRDENVEDERPASEAKAPGQEQIDNAGKSSKRKRSAENRLDVVLGAVSVLGRSVGDGFAGKEPPPIFDKIDLSSYAASSDLMTILVPSRQAESKEEWKEFNSVWPMTFYPNKTKEFIEQAMQLSDAEIEQMKHGMEAAIRDATMEYQHQPASSAFCVGAVVMSPETGCVVATAASERSLQHALLPEKCPPNPLSTSITLAIQGVSRLERQAAISAGGMQNESFRQGQYLCTGYDVYTTVEPTVYEAMALVHSRIRRLVFGCSRHDALPSSTQCGGVTKMKVHALPGTNHHYRAFMCHPGSELWTRSYNPNPAAGK